jgi:GNAT superfamily N-acetyltransferase
MQLKLPIGLQDFRGLRQDGYLYVDKTRHIHRLITEGKYYFLSRPRRFGKSLLLSTIKEVFLGSRWLFEGLWIAEEWDWSQRFPVVHVSFSLLDYQGRGLEQALLDMLADIAKQYGIRLEGDTIKSRFHQLLVDLHAQHGPVVLLIDEYDKPLIDYLDKESLPTALAHQKLLKSFYSVLKDSDAHLRMLFITGVSKFSRVGVFSDLNNLNDITLHPAYATITGITQDELIGSFEGRIRDLAAGANQDVLLNDIKTWYNGYSWDGRQFVYNPFSLLSFFSAGQFQNFWFTTGTPTFLIKLLKERDFVQLENLVVDASVFESYTLENLEARSLLFQTGYLTIKSVDEFQIYTLGYPNKEVEESMLRHLFGLYRHEEPATSGPTAVQLRHAFYANDIERVMVTLNSVFQSVPHHIFISGREAYFHSLVYLTFKMLGMYTQSEVNTASGRVDCVVQTPTHVYLLEFKLDHPAAEALQQIVDKDYAAPYRALGKKVTGVGVRFGSAEKQVVEWESAPL